MTRKEVAKIIAGVKNAKHRLLISLAYGSGLRVGEVVGLQVKDLDLYELTIHARGGNGKKDRITVVPQKIKADLQIQVASKKASDFVFESERGVKLTTRSAQAVFSRALRKAGIKKPATLHSLSHNLATHLLENGVDARYVQELPGHQNIRTTQHYTQVTNPKLKNNKSPL